jgi:hypothetical protein
VGTVICRCLPTRTDFVARLIAELCIICEDSFVQDKEESKGNTINANDDNFLIFFKF